MLRLASILYAIIATSLAGTGVLVVLVTGYVSVPAIFFAAAAGAAIAIPVSWLVAREMLQPPA